MESERFRHYPLRQHLLLDAQELLNSSVTFSTHSFRPCLKLNEFSSPTDESCPCRDFRYLKPIHQYNVQHHGFLKSIVFVYHYIHEQLLFNIQNTLYDINLLCKFFYIITHVPYITQRSLECVVRHSQWYAHKPLIIFQQYLCLQFSHMCLIIEILSHTEISPNRCSAPGCWSNYSCEKPTPVFIDAKMTTSTCCRMEIISSPE